MEESKQCLDWGSRNCLKMAVWLEDGCESAAAGWDVVTLLVISGETSARKYEGEGMLSVSEGKWHASMSHEEHETCGFTLAKSFLMRQRYLWFHTFLPPHFYVAVFTFAPSLILRSSVLRVPHILVLLPFRTVIFLSSLFSYFLPLPSFLYCQSLLSFSSLYSVVFFVFRSFSFLFSLFISPSSSFSFKSFASLYHFLSFPSNLHLYFLIFMLLFLRLLIPLVLVLRF
jgi:hypothetical protein